MQPFTPHVHSAAAGSQLFPGQFCESRRAQSCSCEALRAGPPVVSLALIELTESWHLPMISASRISLECRSLHQLPCHA